MSKNWLKYLVATSAILIAGSAAYFSVTGLGILFSGAAVAVMVMAGSLEFAKLVTATYLKQRWNEIKGFNKWYLSFAVTILMLITSAGIFGYLSNAFQQQNLALQQIDREILVHTTKITQNNTQIVQLSTQITEFNSNQGKIIDNGKVNSRLLRSIDNRDKQIAKLNDKISSLQEQNAKENEEINKIKTANLGLEKEVGGFRFVAEAFGVDLNSVVKFFIILIVIVFDPLAIALVIAFNQLVMQKKEGEESNPEDLKNFVDETTRIHLSENDLKKLEEVLLIPPSANEKLKEAVKRYSDEVREKHTHIDDFDETSVKSELTPEERHEILTEMMKNDQELGLYDEPFNVKPSVSPQNVSEMVLSDKEFEEALKEEMNSIAPFGEFDNEEVKLQEEPTIEDEENNFTNNESIMEIDLELDDDYLTEAIKEFNQESIEEENGWNGEMEKRYWEEQIPEEVTKHEIDEPVYQSEIKEIDEMLKIANDVIDKNTSSDSDDEKKK